MFKKIAIAFIILAILVVIAGAYFWYSIGQPLYEPGMVRAQTKLRAPLTPPDQSEDPSLWNVEDDIQLYHFSQGEGRNVLMIHGGPGYPYADLFPNAQFKVLDEAGHFAFDSHSEAFSGLVAEFLDGLE